MVGVHVALKRQEPWMYLAGTVLLCGGIFFCSCARLVGESTTDIYFRRDTPRPPRQGTALTANPETLNRPCLYWLQPGNQIIGDQTFDAHAYDEKDMPVHEHVVSTSALSTAGKGENSATVTITTLVMLAGYVVQFVAQPGMTP